MFSFVIFVASIAIASAGIIPEHHHGLHAITLPSAHDAYIDHHALHHHHHDSLIAHSPAIVKVGTPVVKYVAQPTVVKYIAQPHYVKVAEPIVLKTYPSHHHHALAALPAYHASPINGLHLSGLGHHHHHDLLH